MTFAEIKRLLWPEPKCEPKLEPSNVVNLDAERSKRWLIKHTRPMPPDPPRAA